MPCCEFVLHMTWHYLIRFVKLHRVIICHELELHESSGFDMAPYDKIWYDLTLNAALWTHYIRNMRGKLRHARETMTRYCICTSLWWHVTVYCNIDMLRHAMSWYGAICSDVACHTSWERRRQDSEAQRRQLVSLCAVSWIKPSQPCGIVGDTSLDPSDVFFQHEFGLPTPSSCGHGCSSGCSHMTDGKQGPAETLCGQSPYQSLPDYMRLHISSSILAIPSYSGG